MNELQRLARATDATRKRFDDKPFEWKRGATCIHLVRYHADRAGHKLPKVPRIQSPLAARRVLKELGHANLCELMDAHFQRIAPAAMRVGDVMALPGDGMFEALVIRASPSKYLGWHQDAEGCTIMLADVGAAVGAWRL
jgi:hypothetical protein